MHRPVSRLLAVTIASGWIACASGIPSSAVEAAPQSAAAGQPAGPEAPAEPPAAGLELVCETFCSQTSLRTGSARLSWVPASDARISSMSLEDAPARLETTVFKDGFERDLYLRLPVSAPGQDLASVQASALESAKMRAYQLRVVTEGAQDEPEMFHGQAVEADPGTEEIVVENLEPGMNYVWRLVVGGPGGEVYSQSVTCQAPVCPADLREE